MPGPSRPLLQRNSYVKMCVCVCVCFFTLTLVCSATAVLFLLGSTNPIWLPAYAPPASAGDVFWLALVTEGLCLTGVTARGWACQHCKQPRLYPRTCHATLILFIPFFVSLSHSLFLWSIPSMCHSLIYFSTFPCFLFVCLMHIVRITALQISINTDPYLMWPNFFVH